MFAQFSGVHSFKFFSLQRLAALLVLCDFLRAHFIFLFTPRHTLATRQTVLRDQTRVSEAWLQCRDLIGWLLLVRRR